MTLAGRFAAVVAAIAAAGEREVKNLRRRSANLLVGSGLSKKQTKARLYLIGPSDGLTGQRGGRQCDMRKGSQENGCSLELVRILD